MCGCIYLIPLTFLIGVAYAVVATIRQPDPEGDDGAAQPSPSAPEQD